MIIFLNQFTRILESSNPFLIFLTPYHVKTVFTIKVIFFEVNSFSLESFASTNREKNQIHLISY